MKNAHLRMGRMTFVRKAGKNAKALADFSVRMDRFIGERGSDQLAQAHFLSVFGGDAQIAAASAIISNQEMFEVEGPGLDRMYVQMEKKAECYRGSIQFSTSRRPLRHLVAVSEDFGSHINANTAGRTLLADSRPEYVWGSLVQVFGLPGVPEWANWFYEKLQDRLAITRLFGVGFRPILITGTKEEFLSWLSEGIRNSEIRLPDRNGPAAWPSTTLRSILLPAETPSSHSAVQ